MRPACKGAEGSALWDVPPRSLRSLRMTIGVSLRNLTSLDWAVLAFAILALGTLPFAGNFGVANREFRVIVLEPALFYFLVRYTRRDRMQAYRLVQALIASALVVAGIGLYQFIFTNDVIVAEGTRRIHAVWGSPNNAALFLGRIIPITLTLALFSLRERHTRMCASTAGRRRIHHFTPT